MSTPSASRGEMVLQPAYFTSSIFVEALRDDINTLISTFVEEYINTRPARPFTHFKALWTSQGWKWMHFLVFDDRAREYFLNVTLRLFLERMVESEAPQIRAIALFGLYTFYFTQPFGTAPALHRVTHIPIPLDQYTSLKTLPSTLVGDLLVPLQPPVSHLISTLLIDGVFLLVPPTHLRALNPRDLPREISIDEETIMPVDPTTPKKKGRPTRLDKARKAKAVLHNLERWLENTPCSQMPPAALSSDLVATLEANPAAKSEVEVTLGHYQNSKSRLLNILDSPVQSGEASEPYAAFQQANQFVLDRLKATGEFLTSDGVSFSTDPNSALSRVECAVKEFVEADKGSQGGILGLLGSAT